MANFNLNRVILGGRLTHDPELKMTPAGVAVTSFGLAVTRRTQTKNEKGEKVSTADFLTIVAWRERAEFVCKYFRKGSSLALVGSIQTRSFTTAQGEKRYATEIVADEIYFVDSKGEGAAPVPAAQQTAGQIPPAYMQQDAAGGAKAPAFEVVDGDEELPF